MSEVARAFVDTNIWIYAHLKVPGDARHGRALALVQVGEIELVIGPQVVAEYYSVMLRNERTDVWIQANLRAMFARTRLQPANAETLSTALALRKPLRVLVLGWPDCRSRVAGALRDAVHRRYATRASARRRAAGDQSLARCRPVAAEGAATPQRRINVLLPNRLSIRSTAISAVRFLTSSAGLSSMTSSEARAPVSAIISMQSCASR